MCRSGWLTCFEQVADIEENVENVHLTEVQVVDVYDGAAQEALFGQTCEHAHQQLVAADHEYISIPGLRKHQTARMIALYGKASEPETESVALGQLDQTHGYQCKSDREHGERGRVD
jgi:hypothetical protein